MDAVAKAQINVLPTFQGTGIKLKLLNALFAGRHCIVNPLMVKNTTLEPACCISNDATEMVKAIETYWKKPFSEQDIENRKALLENSLFNNVKNGQLIVEMLGF